MRRKTSIAVILLVLLAPLGILSFGTIGRLWTDDSIDKNPNKRIRVLFLGNSLTSTNDVPALVQAMAATGGIRIEFEAVTPPGVSLEDQWQIGDGRRKLAESKWDFVVLQQGPSSRPESQVNLREWAMKWSEDARAHGAKPALYMVWPFQGQNNGFKLVAQSYRKAAEACDGLILPAGEAWAECLRGGNSIHLYQADGLHPTLAGSYLAALVITQGITGLKPTSIPSQLKLASGQTITIPEEQAKLLRKCAEKIEDQPNATKFTRPPDNETDEMKRLIDQVKELLDSGKSTTALLTDPQFMPAHEYARFRALIRASAQSSETTLITPNEPGSPLRVSGRVTDVNGQPVRGAIVYVYHTSAKGWYSDRAAHVEGNEGDRKHARLFGYLKTNENGAFEIHTIRPGGYPNSNLPAHIHVEIEPPGTSAAGQVTEIQFDDDLRLTPEMRRRSQQEGFVIAKVKKGATGGQTAKAEFKLKQK
jgi:protocatechuate 3,4-dioxygenase beta subunit